MKLRLVGTGFAGAVLAAALVTTPARAQTFDFDAVPLQLATPLSLTQDGLTATFTTTSPANGFEIAPNFLGLSTLTGHFLYAPQSTSPLDVAFSRPLSALAFNFATDGATTLVLNAFLGGTLVGTASGTGSALASPFYPEGVLAFGGTAFDRVSLVTRAPLTRFAVDNFVATAAATAVPEPATVALVGAGVVGLGALARRRRDPAA